MYSNNKYWKGTSRGSGLSEPSTALTAVAFQDQILRNYSNLSLVNPGPKQRRALINPTPAWRKNAKSTLDTGLVRKLAKKKANKEQEYVLDPKPAPPTLAQRLGLVDAPAGHLTEADWSVVKASSNRREDSKQPCVICKEEFGTDPQVLLSCTHVFHRACLEAFERFTGKKTCPLCRKEQYQKRVIHDGVHHHRQVSATRIQATWRGYVVRKWYTALRETVPPNDPVLRHKFYEKKLKTITDRMVNSYDTDVNAFLRDIDRSLEKSRQVFEHFDETIRDISEEEWAALQLKATERADEDCPICLNSLTGGDVSLRPGGDVIARKHLNPKPKNTTTARKTGSNGKCHLVRPAVRKMILLSCSHVFHKTCFEALEEYAVGEWRFACPVCRSNYQKRTL